MTIRVGFGYDVHQLADGLRLVLGGVTVPHTKGLVAHSDGDVLLHSITDALLGAANMRDIGFHFPDTDGAYKGVDSRELLKKSYSLLKQKGWLVENIDSTICLQKPKLKDFIPAMQENIATDLEIDIDAVSIKATTTEKLGFVGKEEGVSVYAVVLIKKATTK
ncbi:MAG: 2-C-methyl-D-erythritol 2,4-cyclodiphosphate synthase [Bacteroidales bacterium]|nr:2-C-methyl-D-erythritol 2,4-cyclodiphosphate synthase [Bacteroidales bacterium]